MDIFHSLSGMLEVELTSADIPSAIGAITDAGILLHNVRQLDDVTLRFFVYRIHYRKIRQIMNRRGDNLTIISKSGIYWSMKRGMRRPALLLGGIILLLMVTYLPTRVLFVSVEGNSKIPERKILESADHCGISFGASRREVRSEQVKNALLHELPELQWAGVNTRGCVAVISVRERAQAQDVEIQKGVCSILALRDGVITSCTATNGNLLCHPGQAVQAGEVLISGYTDYGITIQATRAEGEVYAQTIRHLQAISPSDYRTKSSVKEIKRDYSLIIGKKRINLWKDSGIWGSTCDRIYEEYYVALPGEFQLPIALAVEEYPIYETDPGYTEAGQPSERLSDFASDYIRSLMVAGTIDSQSMTVTQEDGFLFLEGKYICTEMIGKVQWEQIGEHNGESNGTDRER